MWIASTTKGWKIWNEVQAKKTYIELRKSAILSSFDFLKTFVDEFSCIDFTDSDLLSAEYWKNDRHEYT